MAWPVATLAALSALCGAAEASPTRGALKAMSLFRDGMVLQSSAAGAKHARVWGEAAPGAAVSLCVDTSPSIPCVKAVASADGAWGIPIAVAPSGPHKLSLSAAGATTLTG